LRIKKNKEFEFELDPHSHFLNNAPHINHLVLERVVKMEKERVLLLPFFLFGGSDNSRSDKEFVFDHLLAL
jgi:hypothetical protein